MSGDAGTDGGTRVPKLLDIMIIDQGPSGGKIFFVSRSPIIGFVVKTLSTLSLWVKICLMAQYNSGY